MIININTHDVILEILYMLATRINIYIKKVLKDFVNMLIYRSEYYL